MIRDSFPGINSPGQAPVEHARGFTGSRTRLQWSFSGGVGLWGWCARALGPVRLSRKILGNSRARRKILGVTGPDGVRTLAAGDLTGAVVVVEGLPGQYIAEAEESAAESVVVMDNSSIAVAGSAEDFSAAAAASPTAPEKRVFAAAMTEGMDLATPARVVDDDDGEDCEAN